MKYGYFDDENKEYVITSPDTPVPWVNFLGSRKYGALITNNASGYSFYNSSANGKISRFRFNACYKDTPGRYLYIRDNENNDFWSASWLPVEKPLEVYKTQCIHGAGYTKIISEYDQIKTNTTYFVPLDELYEIWQIKISNESNKTKKLSVFSFVEFSNHDEDKEDMNNLQFTQYISKTEFKENCIIQTINEFNKESLTYRFFEVCGQKVKSWDGSRDNFIGRYNSYSEPLAVKKGICSNTGNYTGNSCGSLHTDIELEPNEEKTLLFILGVGDFDTAQKIKSKYCSIEKSDEELLNLKNYWHAKINVFQVKTPNNYLDSMLNFWHSFECFMNIFWSRSASLIYVNTRNGYGYRDTIADIQSILHLDLPLAKELLIKILSGQVSNGGALPLVDFDFEPGNTLLPGSKEYLLKTNYPDYRCDDCLWLFPAIDDFIKESGDKDFLLKNIPYADKSSATVYEHLYKALTFLLNKLGKHGLVTAIDNDWNDCLKLGKNGESSFASMQLYLSLNIFSEFSEYLGKKDMKKWALDNADKIKKNIQKYCWKKDRYNRAYLEDENQIGNPDSEEASLWLNPQVWAVITGISDKKTTDKILELVRKELYTEYGALLFYPSFRKSNNQTTLMNLYQAGIKENGSIFLMAQAWVIQAEAMAGNGNNAWKYFNAINPASYNDKAEIHETEPYVYGQFVEGKDSPFFGRAHGHWLTGSASTVMVSLVQYLLGIRPDFDGIFINPCIPEEWDKFFIKRIFRGKKLNIFVENPEHVQHGVIKTEINGIIINGNKIPFSEMKEENEIKITMGQIHNGIFKKWFS